MGGASTYWQRSAYPGQRSLIPGRIGREGPGAQHPAHLIHRRGHVHAGVGVHAPGDWPGPAILGITAPSLRYRPSGKGINAVGRDGRTEHFQDTEDQAPARS